MLNVFWAGTVRATFAVAAFVGLMLQLVIGGGMGAKQTSIMAVLMMWMVAILMLTLILMLMVMLVIVATCDWKSAPK